MEVIFAIILLLLIIAFIVEHIIPILIFLGGLAVIFIIFFAVKTIKKRVDNLNSYEEFLETPEKIPDGVILPTNVVYANNYERLLNEEFAAYIEKFNGLIRARAHLEHLKEKQKLQIKFKIKDGGIEGEINDAMQVIRNAEAILDEYTYNGFNSAALITGEIRPTLDTIAPPNKVKSDFAYGFFKEGRPLRTSKGNTILLHDCFVMTYIDNTLRIKEYKSISIKIDEKLARLGDYETPSNNADVYARKWLHERKNGEPDKRYSYNPYYYLVYRPVATISFEKFGHIKRTFEGREAANDFKKKIEALNTFFTSEGNEIVRGILNADDSADGVRK